MWATVRSMSLSVAVAALPALVRPGAPKPGGVGVIGDSYSDPYQFHEPHCASAMNWGRAALPDPRAGLRPLLDGGG